MPPKPAFCTGYGQSDTHAETLSDGRPNPSPSAGQPYGVVAGTDVAAMVASPPSLPKEKAQWFIPSTYVHADARSHERQREMGAFRWLAVDVDTGNLSLSALSAAIVRVAGDCGRIIYSTKSARPEDRKWRVLLPLAAPLSGVDYSGIQTAFFDLLAAEGIECDRALSRPGQLIYLPNAGAYYEKELHRAKCLQLTPSHPIIARRDRDRDEADSAEAMAKARRAKRIAERTASAFNVEENPIDAFNARHDLGGVLESYGWVRLRESCDYRSPFQTSKSYATRILGEGPNAMWISLSTSDAAEGMGITTNGGAAAGDAFDLYCHFNHSGDMRAAVRAYSEESRRESGTLNLEGSVEHMNASQSAADGATTSKAPNNVTLQNRAPIADPMDWPAPDRRYLCKDLLPPPRLPLAEMLTPIAAEWVVATAEGAGAPADYVFGAMMSVVGALVGNSRWVSPWQGWAEPPIIWAMNVGNPSAGKSPAIDAVLAPLRRVERSIRKTAEAGQEEWFKGEKLAKLAESEWEARVKSALKKGDPIPTIPVEADAGVAPHIPRLVVNDGTVEKLGVIAQAQPKGFLQMRDELSGWLLIMEGRNGGSDRAFWLEAFGGRGFTVERIGRSPLTIERLTIGVLGGIQPDRLSELLTKAMDDGLLARFMPIWPGRVPVKQPERFASNAIVDTAMEQLLSLQMVVGENGEPQPSFVTFDHEAQQMMNDWRTTCADWEEKADGLLLSFIGKLPGLAARLSLVLSAIGFAFDGEAEPGQRQITPAEFGRACHYLSTYALPMARRCYGAASVPKAERSARRLLSVIRAEAWTTFTTRQAMRAERAVLATEALLAPAIRALEEGDVIRAITLPPAPKGGRPMKAYAVNPAILEGAQ